MSSKLKATRSDCIPIPVSRKLARIGSDTARASFGFARPSGLENRVENLRKSVVCLRRRTPVGRNTWWTAVSKVLQNQGPSPCEMSRRCVVPRRFHVLIKVKINLAVLLNARFIVLSVGETTSTIRHIYGFRITCYRDEAGVRLLSISLQSSLALGLLMRYTILRR